jgi:TIR domain/NB-ARC domain
MGGGAGRCSALRIAEDIAFRDAEAIPAGQDFEERLERALDECAVLIAVITADWATVTGGDGRARLADPGDWVRREVRHGLQRDDVTVIPLLVDGARMPSDRELPADLTQLSRLKALELTQTRWPTDIDALCARVQEVLGDQRRSLRGRLRDEAEPEIWNVPSAPRRCEDREELLAQLADALPEPGAAPVMHACVLHGMAGVGKTRAAIEFAVRRAAAYDVVWWVRAEDDSTRLSDYAKLADELDLGTGDEVDLEYKARAVRSWLTGRRGWLLVLDDAPTADEVQKLIPEQGGDVLITSRNRAGWDGALCHVDEFTP